jgi:hypothetical protein
MDLPQSKLRKQYVEEVKALEVNINDLMSGEASSELASYAQKKLDKLADRFQDAEEIGSARYKIYELQAKLHYIEGRYGDAEDFVRQAIKTKGSAYQDAEQLLSRIEDRGGNGETKKETGVVFFHKSPTAVALLSFFTLNIYSLYWFYKHWRSIRLSTGIKTYPILSSIFQVFTAYSLFKQIRNEAEKSGYKKFRNAGNAAIGYISLLIFSNGIAKMDYHSSNEETSALVVSLILGIGTALIMAAVQRAANAHNVAVFGKKHNFKSVFVGEIIFAIIGILLFVFYISVTITSVSQNVYPRGTSAEVLTQKSKVDALQADYQACSSDLNARNSTVDTTNSFAVSMYNKDLATCEEKRQQLNAAIDEYNRLAGY